LDMTSLVSLAKSSAFRLLSVANRPIGTVRLRRDVAQTVTDREPLRIAVGVGDARYPSWINTDINWPARNYLDLMKPWPTPPVDRIFADNVIEHFTIRNGRVVLANALAALCPGGGIRIATPDVERTARAYLDNTEIGQRHLERHRRHGYDVHYPVDLLRVTFAGAEHYLGFVYDYASLSAELDRAGFVRITRREAGESDDPAFRNLERRLGETEAATSLIVEAWRAG